jgi:hypothetical protein
MSNAAKVGVGIGLISLMGLWIISDETKPHSQSVNAPQQRIETLSQSPQPPQTQTIITPQRSVSQHTNCHPSYSGCLKADASDYDCAGGSGNGPYYTGPVRVIGPDVFGLDRDGDGWGCE